MTQSAEKDALSEPSTYVVKEVPTWHGRQATAQNATTVATSARTSAGDPPSTPASTCATGTRLGDEDAGSDHRPRAKPPRLVCTCYGGPHGGYTCPGCRPGPSVIPPGSTATEAEGDTP